MPYTIQLDTALETKLDKLKKKDNSLYQRVIHKIIEISKNPELGKPLRNVLKGKRRIHVGSFVLFYSIDKENEIVTFLEFEHHDKAYR
ncbi:addiction module toxin, RelE/StbE family [Candidatus Methanoperedens nitroreducens]|uniref:Addiction module toxin, RelE/StbE family n=1 Tax=Candidatus Methanoperedens nitratireducens TaxID=1392998 RepID=A0A062V0T4_9EURY|nr:type II toxin-antitoxin system RelE/ParE family toxin [Candidatus Methanoperedens nitroreducens]KCZ70962.1 addiction module toxin, RelE/StbE family [Candidatus Methanoperedens nitroreducens]MDJ1421669.1 type II toxin-antitoxin system RelE/ParE family toxin [Candidatus Methanoperedens sp.]